MKSVSVKELTELNVSNIQFEKPIKNKYGSYIANAYIKENNEKKDIFFQTDKVLSVDGIFCNESRSYIEIELNNGDLTTNKEFFHNEAHSGSHRSLPLPSILEVTNLENGRTTKVRVNNRGAYSSTHIINL